MKEESVSDAGLPGGQRICCIFCRWCGRCCQSRWHWWDTPAKKRNEQLKQHQQFNVAFYWFLINILSPRLLSTLHRSSSSREKLENQQQKYTFHSHLTLFWYSSAAPRPNLMEQKSKYHGVMSILIRAGPANALQPTKDTGQLHFQHGSGLVLIQEHSGWLE